MVSSMVFPVKVSSSEDSLTEKQANLEQKVQWLLVKSKNTENELKENNKYLKKTMNIYRYSVKNSKRAMNVSKKTTNIYR